jgi:hypothetical protein
VTTPFGPVVCSASMRSRIARSQYDHRRTDSITHFRALIFGNLFWIPALPASHAALTLSSKRDA